MKTRLVFRQSKALALRGVISPNVGPRIFPNLCLISSGRPLVRNPCRERGHETPALPILLDQMLTQAVCCEGNSRGQGAECRGITVQETAYFSLMVGSGRDRNR